MTGKWSLFSLVTISKAELATRSWIKHISLQTKIGIYEHNKPVKTFEAAEKTPNIVRHPDRIFCALA